MFLVQIEKSADVWAALFRSTVSNSMQTAIHASRRIVLLTCGSLSAAAVAVAGAPLLAADGLAGAAASAFAVLLLAAAAATLYAGRRLTGVLGAAEDAAARSRSELQVTLDNMSQGLVLCDTAANVVAVNNRFLQLFGIRPRCVWPGMAVADLIRLQAEAGNMPAEQTEAIIHERLTRQPGSSGQLVMPFHQSLFHVAYQPRPEGGWACTFEDVTAQKEAERRLAFMARHDSLTSLPNRTLLHERIDAAVAAGAAFALMLVDLDHFKQANDTFGHLLGDALLCAVSGRLCAETRDGDTVARLGGDEFAVLMSAPCTREEADRQAARLTEALAEPFEVEGRRLRIGGSIGISLATGLPDRGTALDTDMLLRQADLALYRAKKDGRGAHRFFEPSMQPAPLAGCELA
jgi:diguanylate cyclase (GGDEF)-like protein